MFYGDSMGYYVYLPATFIYHNLQDMDQLPPEDSLGAGIYSYVSEMKAVSVSLGEQHWVNQYTYGVALLEAPFFLAAHIYEKLLGQSATGYSSTYNNAIVFSSLIYTLLGLWLIFLVIKRKFGPVIAAITCTLILLGTNLFWFAFWQGGMSHTPLFFLYAALVYLTIKLHEQPKRKYFLLIGFIMGLITVIRPTDILVLLIPLLYNVYSKKTLQDKIKLIKANSRYIWLAVLIFFIPIIPQLLYWQITTGQLVYYSYGEQSFNWKHPKLIQGLFYFKNGWLPYAPVMLFALAGILMFRKNRQWLAVFFTLIPVYCYIIYSWWCYTYINGFGSRPMIHLYPLLAIPLASFTWLVARGNFVIKLAYGALCIFIISVIYSLCGLQTQFFFKSEVANAAYYMGMIYKDRLNYDNLVEMDVEELQPNEEKLVKIKTIARADFDDSLNNHFVPDPEDTGYAYHMWEGQEYTDEGIMLTYSKNEFKDAKWLKCSGRFMVTDYAEHIPHKLVCTITDGNGELIKWSGCGIDNKIGLVDSTCEHVNDKYTYMHYEYWIWSTIYFYTKIPCDIDENCTIKLTMWNQPKKQVFMDDFKIELYK